MKSIFFRLILLIGLVICPPASSVPDKMNTAVFVFPPLTGRKFCDKFAEGDRYFSKGQLLKAVDSYQILLLPNSDPCLQKSDIYARCAWMYYLQANWPKAKYFTNLALEGVDKRDSYFQNLQFKLLVESKNWREALLFYKSRPKSRNGLPESLEELELLYGAGLDKEFERKLRIFENKMKGKNFLLKPCFNCSRKDYLQSLSEARKLLAGSTKMQTLINSPFNSAVWKDSWQPTSPIRMRQTNSLITTNRLMNMDKRNVRKLLGDPVFYAWSSPSLDFFPLGAFKNNYADTYELVSSRAHKWNSVYCLVVSYDLEDKAVGFFVADCGRIGI